MGHPLRLVHVGAGPVPQIFPPNPVLQGTPVVDGGEKAHARGVVSESMVLAVLLFEA